LAVPESESESESEILQRDREIGRREEARIFGGEKEARICGFEKCWVASDAVAVSCGVVALEPKILGFRSFDLLVKMPICRSPDLPISL
jgi:hypothetical protein